MIQEVWKDVIEYEGFYQVSNCGRVKSLSRKKHCGHRGSKPQIIPEKIMKLSSRRGGYLIVPFYKNGCQRYFFVHRLVLEAFVGPCSKGMECSHEDDNPTNNWLGNLSWDIPKNNCRKRGNYGIEKLSEKDVKEIRRLYSLGKHTMQQLADSFGVDYGTINSLLHRRTWAHVI